MYFKRKFKKPVYMHIKAWSLQFNIKHISTMTNKYTYNQKTNRGFIIFKGDDTNYRQHILMSVIFVKLIVWLFRYVLNMASLMIEATRQEYLNNLKLTSSTGNWWKFITSCRVASRRVAPELFKWTWDICVTRVYEVDHMKDWIRFLIYFQ